jgi:hypothetical protein
MNCLTRDSEKKAQKQAAKEAESAKEQAEKERQEFLASPIGQALLSIQGKSLRAGVLAPHHRCALEHAVENFDRPSERDERTNALSVSPRSLAARSQRLRAAGLVADADLRVSFPTRSVCRGTRTAPRWTSLSEATASVGVWALAVGGKRGIRRCSGGTRSLLLSRQRRFFSSF